MIRPSRNGGCRIDKILEVRRQAVRQHHDDREDHRRRADDGRADQHRLGRGLEGVARAVVLFEEVLGLLEVRSKPKCFLISVRCRESARSVDSSNTDWALSVTGPYESTAIVTGPMPRKPNATRPNANTAGATIRAAQPGSADDVGDAHQAHDRHAQPVGAEVTRRRGRKECSATRRLRATT